VNEFVNIFFTFIVHYYIHIAFASGLLQTAACRAAGTHEAFTAQKLLKVLHRKLIGVEKRVCTVRAVSAKNCQFIYFAEEFLPVKAVSNISTAL
jgi:hypothetical protein